MSFDTKLTKDEECESVDSTKYRGMIGSLLYLTASRSDIMFSVCLCARFQEAPKTSHLEAVKRIFRYIKGTAHLGLWCLKGTGIETVVYVDYDHARDYVDRKSTSGICTFMRYCLTSWLLKKQTALAISTTEAEYVSTKKACQVRRIRHEEEIDVHEYQVLTRKIEPTLKHLDEIIRENVFCLGVIGTMFPQDRGTRRGRHSASSSTFNEPSSSYLNDDGDDGNNKGTTRASTRSLILYVNSLTNEVPQVFQNPPNIDPHLEPFYTRQTEIINRQLQIQDEHRGGLRSIRKGLRNLWRYMKK
uniref:Uncharacterized mitochondrial protein AtMg00810-like n=1 Tax=Tanacetum cinerariifolium TaxID=118510 RepID=A0A699HDU4_TANCI|nr:uncharacterized mitochondrial protein AtMg00810-like [Tanacetum cinerariifolium]